ncbi:set domain-containing protein [Cyclospora cayetanensis]|uniref:Set domain-containing protein n=1 Tax=Cyclospora cayetanensis TaxID=88456 RepID=A0A1D3DA14_9EIME|nr:set domain-containing protein [Cyclospora cayetanensis]
MLIVPEERTAAAHADALARAAAIGPPHRAPTAAAPLRSLAAAAPAAVRTAAGFCSGKLRPLHYPPRGFVLYEAGVRPTARTAVAAAAAGAAGEGEDDVCVELSDFDSDAEGEALYERMRQHRQELLKQGLLKRKRNSLQEIEPLDVGWLLASDPKRGFDYLTLDEKAAFLSLKYLHLLSSTCLIGKEKLGGSTPLWKLSHLTGERRIPPNLLGPGVLKVPPGFRCLTIGQLRVLGIHCSSSRICVGADEDKTQTATSILLNDSRFEDKGTMLIVHGENPDPQDTSVYPGDQLIALGGSSQKNTALWTAWKHEYPVRVIRGYQARSEYAPEVGFRYDGLYRVVELLFDTAEPPESLYRDARAGGAPPTTAGCGAKSYGRGKGLEADSSRSSTSRTHGESGTMSSDEESSDTREESGDNASSTTPSPPKKHAAAERAAAEAAGLSASADTTQDTVKEELEEGEEDVKLLSYTQTKARSREMAAAAGANATAAAGTRPPRQEERLLKGRCVFKFLLLSIHSKQYSPPTSRWRHFRLDDMSHPLWDKDKRLKQMRQLAKRQFAAHRRIQQQLEMGDDLALTSTTTRVVEVYGQLLQQWGSTSSRRSDPVSCAQAALTVAREAGRFVKGSSLSQRCCEGFAALETWESGNAPAWAACGFLPLVLCVESYELELTPASYAERQRLVDAYLNEAAAAAEAAEGAVSAAGQRWGGAGWEGGGRRSATCGIVSSLILGAPLPASWSPWADISQGQEAFPIIAINDVDAEPPPTDFCYQTRNILFGRLPSSSMLCLCTGCVPPGVDTTDWERIASHGCLEGCSEASGASKKALRMGGRACIGELPSYCDAVRDPVTGRIYCGGANPAFVSAFRPIASCSAHCLCSPEYCANRLPEDLQYRVAVAKTRHAGWELRTLEAIPKGAFIMQYVGEVIPRAVMDGRSRQEARRGYHNYCMEAVGEERDLEYDWAAPCIDSLFIGNASRFLNHSCNPNVRVATIWRGPSLPLVGVFAQEDIPAAVHLPCSWVSKVFSPLYSRTSFLRLEPIAARRSS